MAAFIARSITAGRPGLLPSSPPDAFVDDKSSAHELAINQLAALGVVRGTGPGIYSPSRPVTRGQMARFLANASEQVLGQALPVGPDVFEDDADSPFEEDINRIAHAGLTGGRADGLYAPGSAVTRAQMGSFLARTLDLFVEHGSAVPTR